MIHIGRAGARLGSFSEFEIRQGLASGRFFPADLGWKEGMENWAPLSQFSEFAATPPPLPPLPGEADAAPPEAAEPGGLPWDGRREAGFLAAFMATARMVLLAPSAAFARMLAAGGMGSPLLYNLIGGYIGLVGSGIYLVLTSRLTPAPANLTPFQALFYMSPQRALSELIAIIFLGPFLVTISSIVCATVAHLFLMLAGGPRKPWHVTLRVFCFSYGSTQLLQLFPLFGGPLALVWLTVCCVMGLAIAHGTTTGRALTAMGLLLLAGIACFACLVGALVWAMSLDH